MIQYIQKGFKMTFNAIIEKDQDGYFAYVPALQGCISQGDTYEEVVENIKEAMELYLESLKSEQIKKLISQSISIMPIEVAINA